MLKKILNSLKSLKIFYLGLIPIIYISIVRGINQAHEHGIEKFAVEEHSAVKKIVPNFKIGTIYGILTFFILIIVWILVLKLLSQIIKDNKFIKDFFILGQMSVDNIITKVFHVGLILVAFYAYILSKSFNLFWRFFNINKTLYSDLFIFIISYIITFAIILALWKIVCELLIIMFRCFEVYYESKKNISKE